MEFVSAFEPLYALSGFAVGFVVGMTGVGGGSLMTPLLILFFGIHPVTAVGTDLLFAAVTKTVGTLVHGTKGTIDWRIVSRLAAGSVPTTALTLLALANLGIDDSATRGLITTTLGAALVLTGVVLIFRDRILTLYAAWVSELGPGLTARLTVATGATLGFLVALSSVGAGAIGVTALILLYPTMRARRIVGSDIAHAVPLTLVAGLGHWIIGSVDWLLLATLLVGSLPGIYFGSQASVRVPESALRPILAIMLLVVGGRLLL